MGTVGEDGESGGRREVGGSWGGGKVREGVEKKGVIVLSMACFFARQCHRQKYYLRCPFILAECAAVMFSRSACLTGLFAPLVANFAEFPIESLLGITL